MANDGERVASLVDKYGDTLMFSCGEANQLVRWIEQIPFAETKGYVQRVMENSVVYDRLNPTLPMNQTSVSLSNYLGKSRPG